MINNVVLVGNLTKDPQITYTQDQKCVAKFSIAINSGYGDNARVDYPNIVVFGKVAENCEKYLSKGSKVAIIGRIQTGSYTNKDGAKVYTTDVIANNVEFLSPIGKSEVAPKEQEFEELQEDVPF